VNPIDNDERRFGSSAVAASRRLRNPAPVGGGKSIGKGAANTMRLVADDVRSHLIPERGPWVAEEAPDQLPAAITPFLASYRS
jgi:hypothetical protein